MAKGPHCCVTIAFLLLTSLRCPSIFSLPDRWEEPKGRSYSHMQKGNRIVRRILSRIILSELPRQVEVLPQQSPELTSDFATSAIQVLQLTVRHHRLHAYHFKQSQKIRRKHEFSGQRKCYHTCNNTSNFIATVVQNVLFFFNGARGPQSQECLRSMRVRLAYILSVPNPRLEMMCETQSGSTCMCNLNWTSMIFLQLYFLKATPILVFMPLNLKSNVSISFKNWDCVGTFQWFRG